MLAQGINIFFSSFVYLLLFPQCLVWFSWMQLCAEIVKAKIKNILVPLLSKPHCALYVWWYKINIRIVSSKLHVPVVCFTELNSKYFGRRNYSHMWCLTYHSTGIPRFLQFRFPRFLIYRSL